MRAGARRLRERDAFILGVIDAEIFGQVCVEPGADFVPEGFLLEGIFKIQELTFFALLLEPILS
jgi:hypothetical protein